MTAICAKMSRTPALRRAAACSVLLGGILLGSLSALGDDRDFVGKWTGVWPGHQAGGGFGTRSGLISKLTVYSVSNGEADVLYSWETNEIVTKPGTTRLTGRIEDEKLRLNFRNGASATFTMKDKDTLAGSYFGGGGSSAGHFHRVQRESAMPSAAEAKPAPSTVPQGFHLTAIEVDPDVKIGRPYTIRFRYAGSDDPSIKRVCFPGGGEAVCWDAFSIDRQDRTIETQSTIGATGTYTLTGYVEYEQDGKTLQSNQASSPVTVR